ncbi:CRISP-associated protein Cas1 [[Clostridium] aminophilum]|uniref:CRISPR-associated endonuclease Cas1 n=1 Tax=[Clostridium] aminophilum TaxID=1526 RepID=A0A1I0A039_9FIRM|nr:type I-C CRISPR-associated endonuclease Cas1c [[Clostridium] aminophilum]SES87409.1 CRISP-associated protein Cas1 [[Clostridium] aminophilum]
MRKLLNTLFVTNEDAYLSLKGETVIVEVGKIKVGQFPLINFEEIVCFSYRGASPQLLGKCAERGIGVSFFSPYGKFLFRVIDNENGNVLLRKTQYHVSDNEDQSVLIVKNFIVGKIYNCKWLLDRTMRDHELRIDLDKLKKAKEILSERVKQALNIGSLDEIRGVEGEAAQVYFSCFDELILNQKESFHFQGRNRRPPLDNVNALLSFGYSLLTNECFNALQMVGLDPYVGFLHRDRPGRKSLALDLMEELRPVLVDRFVLTLINNRQIKEDDFVLNEGGAVTFTESGRKLFLTEWQNHKKEVITHPYLKEKVQWGIVPYIQALLLARYIRGDLDGYPPFLWR